MLELVDPPGGWVGSTLHRFAPGSHMKGRLLRFEARAVGPRVRQAGGQARVPFVAHFTVDGGTVTGTLDGIGGEIDPIIENGRLDGNTVPSPPSARSRTSR